MHVREFERRFEIFKAAYERPIAEQHARFEQERLASIAQRVQAAKAERLKLRNLKETGDDARLPSKSVVLDDNAALPYENMFLSRANAKNDAGAPKVKGKKRSRTPKIDQRLALIDKYLDEHRQELQRMAGKAPAAMLEELFKDVDGASNANENILASSEQTVHTFGELVSVEEVTDMSEEAIKALEEDPLEAMNKNEQFLDSLLRSDDPEQEVRQLEQSLESFDADNVDDADKAIAELAADQMNSETDGNLGFITDDAVADDEDPELVPEEDEDDDVDDIGDVDDDAPTLLLLFFFLDFFLVFYN